MTVAVHFGLIDEPNGKLKVAELNEDQSFRIPNYETLGMAALYLYEIIVQGTGTILKEIKEDIDLPEPFLNEEITYQEIIIHLNKGISFSMPVAVPLNKGEIIKANLIVKNIDDYLDKIQINNFLPDLFNLIF